MSKQLVAYFSASGVTAKNPVFTSNIMTLFYFVIDFPAFTLNQCSRIGFIFQNTIDGNHCPLLIQPSLKTTGIVESIGSLILVRRQDTQFVQVTGNAL